MRIEVDVRRECGRRARWRRSGRRGAAVDAVATSMRCRIAALRSALSNAAASRAYASSRGREVPSGKAGNAIAARIAMTATTQMISTSVKPACPVEAVSGPAGDVGRSTRTTFLPIRAVGNDVIGTVLSRRPVDIRTAPWVTGDHCAPQIRTIPARGDVAGALYQRGKAFRARRIAPDVEIEKVERASEALDLDLGCLGLRFGQIVEHARTDQGHDQADDGDHHQDFDQREPPLAASSGA